MTATGVEAAAEWKRALLGPDLLPSPTECLFVGVHDISSELGLQETSEKAISHLYGIQRRIPGHVGCLVLASCLSLFPSSWTWGLVPHGCGLPRTFRAPRKEAAPGRV